MVSVLSTVWLLDRTPVSYCRLCLFIPILRNMLRHHAAGPFSNSRNFPGARSNTNMSLPFTKFLHCPFQIYVVTEVLSPTPAQRASKTSNSKYPFSVHQDVTKSLHHILSLYAQWLLVAPSPIVATPTTPAATTCLTTLESRTSTSFAVIIPSPPKTPSHVPPTACSRAASLTKP